MADTKRRVGAPVRDRPLLRRRHGPGVRRWPVTGLNAGVELAPDVHITIPLAVLRAMATLGEAILR